MENLLPRQQKRLERLAKSLKDRDIAAIEHLSDIEEKVEDVAAFVASEISGVKEELKKKLDTVYEIDPEEIRGPKGDDGADGEPGLDADEEEIIDRLTPVLLSKIPTPQEVAAYVPNLKGDPGVAPTVEEIVAAIPKPKDGRDGSPDTPLEAARKLNTLRDAIEPTVIKGLDEIGRLARIGASNVAAPSVSHTALQQLANRVTTIENTPTVSTDEKAKVSANDTTAGYLNGKLVAGSNITLTENSDGGNETLTIAGSAGYTDEQAQDAVGAMVNSTLTYTDATPLLGINLANANSWTAAQTQARTALGTTTVDGWVLDNTTNAAAGAQQVSPALRFRGRGWSTGGAGSSQTQDFRQFVLPVQGASGATGLLKTQISRNGAAYSDILTQSTTGEIVQTVLSGVSALTGYEISGPWGNSTPGTTRALRLNSTNGYNIVDFNYSGTLRQSIVGASAGNIDLYASGGNYFSFYSGNSGLTSNTLMAQIVPVGFYNNGGNFNAGRVTAGQATTSPPTTLSVYGSTSFKTAVITSPTTLDDTVTQVLVDCSSYNVCSGTPSQTACSTYTGSGQATCESHLPCTWNPGSSCSDFNNESGMGTCAGTSGCSVDTTSCAGPGDQTTCEAQDDSYGGLCAWTLGSNTCPSYTDTSSCNAASPCYATLGGDCTTLSDGGGDGSACATQPECSYDSGSGVCSGSYFTSCDGDNSTYSCTGSYNTGSCSGTYGVSCDGTVTCVGYGDSGSCAAETGCSWTSGVDVTLPASPVEQTYLIAKDYTSGTLRILPNSGQTVNNTTAITSTSTAGKSWVLTWFDSKSNWAIMAEH